MLMIVLAVIWALRPTDWKIAMISPKAEEAEKVMRLESLLRLRLFWPI